MTPRAIWKFILRPIKFQELDMPRGAVVLSAQQQDGAICVWAEVLPDAEPEPRVFAVYATGELIDPSTNRTFVGTVQFPSNMLVFHVYEETTP